MTKYKALSIVTEFWMPKENYLNGIIEAVSGKVKDGDFVVVSEKAISTVLGNIVDESKIIASSNAKFIAGFWMRIVWGYPLGVLCHFGQRLLKRLRAYPFEHGGKHKQVVLEHAGLGQALMFGSEGAIDGSNLPYSLVSLPLENSQSISEQIQREIQQCLGKKVCVIVVDTDKTYRFGNFCFTPRPSPLEGIHSFSHVALLAYVIGKFLRLRESSTPLAVAGVNIDVFMVLKIANIADRARGAGSGATVWDMASRFHVQVNCVTWDMLFQIEHKPIVIVRKT
ncbi:MAG: coenzyme F420-0:L-glutamate ligase [Nitrososphaerota archaeon]|jgi:F420-0:gamma-glutamyl ligase-like protein|uniref:coenzyme F420-0:L-glutamate ligase n=1 Tax=Candidatus Bathycorpusculum sp. TaxID=2994959 RepID=UPI00281E9F33|nr:coenzyme F420-0:L-glutamate ligase [Candidatus Termiticorpusculum sp.]MCL2257228.1 coenzyme F420-0:L-glutamate ligase [Candidatus Termiticorpusculum sp.]MCL2292626.1 coenzyme F420-0:L-glutamate ligase [Candidatus Termiticorpusculum sp.]MDR0459974.1 coenzyme F420-0:L-glutamate ligase [Nitrososphaerota archaeon]